MEKIALYKGNSRYETVLNTLNLVKDDILRKIKDKKQIIIKPNCVSDNCQLASTHVDALRAVLDFLKPYYKKPLTIAEGSTYSTKTAFENFNYTSLKYKYNLRFFDLNNDKFSMIQIFDSNMKPLKVAMANTLLQSDCIISLAVLKTHDSVVGTFSIKNIAVGGLIKKSLITHRIPSVFLRKVVNRVTSIRNDKMKVHQDPKTTNKNIFEIYKKVSPDIGIVDGFQAMEGNGPIDGQPVDLKLAIAGTNAIAVDSIASQLIGINPHDIGYLHYILNFEKLNINNIKVIGNTSVNKAGRKFKLHDNIKWQNTWKN